MDSDWEENDETNEDIEIEPTLKLSPVSSS